MADSLLLTEGKDYKEANGWPANPYFGLSTKKVGTQLAGEWLYADHLADIAEITGTGYIRKTVARPTSVAGVMVWPALIWVVGAGVSNWLSPKSVFALTTNDGTAKVLGAANLVVGGAAQAMPALATLTAPGFLTTLGNVGDFSGSGAGDPWP